MLFSINKTIAFLFTVGFYISVHILFFVSSLMAKYKGIPSVLEGMPSFCKIRLNYSYVGSSRAFGSLFDVKGDLITLIKRFETNSIDT